MVHQEKMESQEKHLKGETQVTLDSQAQMVHKVHKERGVQEEKMGLMAEMEMMVSGHFICE